jgi:Flp pilus assembly protein TadD
MNFWKIAAIAASLALPAAANAEWREAETPHFRIYSNGGEQQLNRFAERLETFDSLLRKLASVPATVEPVKVRVFLLDTEDQVRRAYHGSDPSVAGFYLVNMEGPLAVSPRRTDVSDSVFGPEIVLFHEYAHHFMLQYFPVSYPAWYVEGFAEMASTAAPMSGGKMAFGKAASHRGYSLTQSRWVPVSQLLTQSYSQFPKDGDFYGQAWLLSHYLTFAPARKGQIYRYLGALAAGRPQADAAREVFGDLEALNREARHYLDAQNFGYSAIEVQHPAAASIRLRLLTPGESALVGDMAAFRDHVDEKERAAWIAEVRAKAARYPADPHVLQFLADAEFAAQDYPAALATADKWLAVAPGDVQAMTRKATILLEQADGLEGSARTAKIASARALIVAANRTDPDDPKTLVAFYEAYRISGERPPPIAIEALKQAVGTMPQAYRPRMLLATALANQGKYDEAIFYLGPIAYDPHSSDGQQAALNMIGRLREAMAGK